MPPAAGASPYAAVIGEPDVPSALCHRTSTTTATALNWDVAVLSRHRVAAGEVRYCRCRCGDLLVFLDGRLVGEVRRSAPVRP